MKNLKKISREDLSTIQGGAIPYNDGLGGLYCPNPGHVLCLVGCKPACVSGSQCYRNSCLDVY